MAYDSPDIDNDSFYVYKFKGFTSDYNHVEFIPDEANFIGN